MLEVVIPALDEAQLPEMSNAIPRMIGKMKFRILNDQFFPSGTGVQTFCYNIRNSMFAETGKLCLRCHLNHSQRIARYPGKPRDSNKYWKKAECKSHIILL